MTVTLSACPQTTMHGKQVDIEVDFEAIDLGPEEFAARYLVPAWAAIRASLQTTVNRKAELSYDEAARHILNLEQADEATD